MITRENEVVTEEVANGMKHRYFLNELSCSGGGSYQKINADSTIMLHNAKKLVNEDLSDIEGISQMTSGGKVFLSVNDLVARLVERAQELPEVEPYGIFALVWAEFTEESLTPKNVEYEGEDVL